MMRKFITFNFKFDRKKMIAVMLFLCAGFIAGYIFFISVSNNDIADTVMPIESGDMDTNTMEKHQIENKPIKQQQVKVDSIRYEKHILEYPFIEMQQSYGVASSGATSSPVTSLPAIPNYSYSESMPRSGRPLIPSQIPTRPSGTVGVKQVAEIKGILTGGAQNIAIMSNGNVLKEGDRYMGNDITYIDKNGITFSNGNQIAYQQIFK